MGQPELVRRDPQPAAAAADSSALVLRLRRGESAAWTELYRSHSARLYRAVLFPRLGQRAAAEDALAETFRVAIERIHQFEERDVDIYFWLARIAQNKAMDMHRHNAMKARKLVDLRGLLEPLGTAEPGADALLELATSGQEVRARIETTLDGINPRYKRAIVLRFFEEKGREECAELLEVKVATFDVVLLRALRAFRESWTQALQNGEEVGHDATLGTQLA
jgi:RNA polymerase sigma-70 factor (ECF subfamily)